MKAINPLFSLVPLLILAGCATSRPRVLRVVDQVNMEAAKPDYDLSVVSGLTDSLKKEGLSPKALNRYSDDELARLYMALANITFLFPEDEYFVEMQERAFQIKSDRGIRLKLDVDDMYSAYLAARMFKKAAAIKRQFPDIRFYAMPEKIISTDLAGATRWRVYDVADGGKTIELKALPMGQGHTVVMLMLPGCGVAEKAMKEILADPDLGPVFRQYGAVMTKSMNAESVALWKNHFGFPNVYLAYKASDFPDFDFSLSPNFYFLSDGIVKSQVDGWHRDWRQRIVKGFESISIPTRPSE